MYCSSRYALASSSLKLPRAGHVLVSGVLLGGGVYFSPAQASEYFDPSAIQLRGGQQAVDLNTLSAGGQLPGTYRVDVIVNGEIYETRDLTFTREQDGGPLVPVLTAADLRAMGVNDDVIPAFQSASDDTVVTDIGSLIPGASTQFDFNRQRLDIRVPQASMNAGARGEIDPSKWDQGLPALLMDYNVSGNESEYNGTTTSSAWMGLNTGLNLGAWRLRNQSSWNRSDSTGSDWESINTYIQRDIHTLRSQLVMGDSTTQGDVFDSVQFRGVQLASDDAMLPDSLRGFAPVVRGIAKSDAQVIIRQNGYMIYQRNVPPGPFAITDIYSTASSGNLDVTVKEADGSESTFVQPFSAVPVMQREGGIKYSLTGGEYRSASEHASTPGFMEGSVIYGLSNSLTLYTGTQLSDNYRALLAGVGLGFGDLGSFSFDVTQARSILSDDSEHTGQSYSFEYAKDVFQSGTTFTLAGYRYSTEGFYDFSEVNEMEEGNDIWRNGYNKRSKLSLQVSQSLDTFGSLYINGYQQDYWLSDEKERTLTAGYSGSWDGISYGLNVSATRVPGSDTDTQVALSVSVPLSKWLPSAWANYSVSTDSDGRTSHDAGISGTALERDNLSYSVSQSYANKDVGYGGRAYATYQGTYGTVNGGYSYGNDTRTLNYGFSGAAAAHPYGVTFGQSMSDTAALVRAPGASGADLQSQTGVSTDWRGYALVPYVNVYRKNRISLDPGSLGEGVDLDASVQTVIPTRGALVLADFDTRVGARALVSLTTRSKPVPFGAMVTVAQDGGRVNSGIVGPEGEVYLSGLPERGQLQVSWGSGADERCVTDYTLPSLGDRPPAGVQTFSAVCR